MLGRVNGGSDCSGLLCYAGGGSHIGFLLAILRSSIVDDGEGDSVACLGAILQLLSLASSLDRTTGGGRPALHGIGAIGPRGVHFLHGRPS